MALKLERIGQAIANWIDPPRVAAKPRPKVGASRLYAAARISRLTANWPSGVTSADGELASSLSILRNRSRSLVRDTSYAKRAKKIVVNNVIGSGVGLQAQVLNSRGKLREDVNAAIEEAYRQWSRADSCHTGGAMHFADLERAAMGQVFDAGEVFLRKHYRPFGDSKVPLALELIEAERIADEYQPATPAVGNLVRLGIEVDTFYRPVAYFIRSRHPGELRAGLDRSTEIERVPASDIIHLRIVDRWPQTRGEPWLHAAAKRIQDVDGYSEAEIVGARAASAYMATIESDADASDFGEEQDDGSLEMELQAGLVAKLDPGERLNFVAPNRPNTAMDPFMRLMIREIAAGADVSYESLSRDYSQSNYSSSRLALLDDRDLWKVLQAWWIRSFREPFHREWIRQAILARAVRGVSVAEFAEDPEKFSAALFKARGWTWIDPTKEVAAYKEAVKAGFTTVTDVIAATANGADIEDVLQQRRRELDMMEELDLDFDTTYEEPEEVAPTPAAVASAPEEKPDDGESEDRARARVVAMRGIT